MLQGEWYGKSLPNLPLPKWAYQFSYTVRVGRAEENFRVSSKNELTCAKGCSRDSSMSIAVPGIMTNSECQLFRRMSCWKRLSLAGPVEA